MTANCAWIWKIKDKMNDFCRFWITNDAMRRKRRSIEEDEKSLSLSSFLSQSLSWFKKKTHLTYFLMFTALIDFIELDPMLILVIKYYIPRNGCAILNESLRIKWPIFVYLKFKFNSLNKNCVPNAVLLLQSRELEAFEYQKVPLSRFLSAFPFW